MSGEAAVAVRSWPVGRFVCEMTLQRPKLGSVVNAVCAWSPSEPSGLSASEWAEYRAGRNRAIGELAAQLGVSVAVIEV